MCLRFLSSDQSYDVPASRDYLIQRKTTCHCGFLCNENGVNYLITVNDAIAIPKAANHGCLTVVIPHNFLLTTVRHQLNIQVQQTQSLSWSAGSSWATTGGHAAPPVLPLSYCPSHPSLSWWVFLREHTSNVLSVCGSFSSWPLFALRWLPKAELLD